MRKLNPRRKKPCTGDPRLHDAQIDDDAMDRTRMEPTADGRQGDKEVKEEGDAIEMVPRKDSRSDDAHDVTMRDHGKMKNLVPLTRMVVLTRFLGPRGLG